MSLILEALKKSERQRRLGESPSLGSPVIAVRRRRSVLPILVVLIAIGLIALWWMRRDGTEPVPSAQNSTAPASTAGKIPASSAKAPDATTLTDAQPPGLANQPLVNVSNARNPSADMADAERRRKLDDGELVAAGPKLGRAATIKESEPVSAADPAALAAAMADAGSPAAAQMPRTPSPAKPVMVEPPSSDESGAIPLNPGSASARVDGLKLMWELPLATRQKLPEIKLSMHVFAKDPTQRFVIINGDRHVQGDDIDSMVLSEIRADGVVFEHEGMRFLYPRGGR